ncbi:MAG: hypothetical protein J6Y07_02965 [Alphaproteobacteria bacterium]|nr:hypothetical protein [Alphaproteobacteria bacterium]
MHEYTIEYENKMLTRMQALIEKPDFKDLYEIGHDLFGRPRMCVRLSFGQYEQIVTLDVYKYKNRNYALSWGHVFPRPSESASLAIGGYPDGVFRTAQYDDIKIGAPENIKKAQSLSKIFNSIRYASNIVKQPKKTNPQLSKALEELARNHYTDSKQDYGLKLFDVFLQHVK